MYDITFKRIDGDEARIHQGDDFVGELYRQDDILNPGSVCYIIHLWEDPRGWKRVKDRNSIRETVARLLATHPLR